ncbi:MAG: hypothetical protein II207_06600 [Clostridia bacterium]|nr:hypothetical protein [Clostridia bacterium]
MTGLFDIDWGFETPEIPAEQTEAQSEPKGRKTRSHLKAKVYETSDRFEYRRAFSEIQLLDALGGTFQFQPGTAYHFITAGNIDSLSFLKAVLRQQSVRQLVVSTWCMGADDILWFREQAEAGRIEKMDLYLGEIFSGSYRTEFSMVKDLYTDHPELGRYALFRNHSKIMAGIGDKFAFAIESSANINTNPRTENTVVTIDEGLYQFHKDYFDGIISIEK